jgi:hypothetical protein
MTVKDSDSLGAIQADLDHLKFCPNDGVAPFKGSPEAWVWKHPESDSRSELVPLEQLKTLSSQLYSERNKALVTYYRA